MTAAEQVIAGIKAGVMHNPSTVIFKHETAVVRLTEQSGGVYNLSNTGQGMGLNMTSYIFSEGGHRWEAGEIVMINGERYQLGEPSQTRLFGVVIHTQCPVQKVVT